MYFDTIEWFGLDYKPFDDVVERSAGFFVCEKMTSLDFWDMCFIMCDVLVKYLALD